MIRIYTTHGGSLELAAEYGSLEEAKAAGRVPDSVETERELLKMFDGPRVVAEVDREQGGGEAEKAAGLLERLLDAARGE